MLAKFRGRARLFAWLLLPLVACEGVTGPAWPTTAKPLPIIPIQFASWWHMVESCSGLTGDMSAVHWYYDHRDPIVSDGQEYDGMWSSNGNRIVLGMFEWYHGDVVRHEMLHALLHAPGHPTEYFVKRCGALAPCRIACDTSEADRGVPLNARLVPSESLEVAVSLAPQGAPSMSLDSGWVTIVVTATNARAEPVWASVPNNLSLGYVFAKIPGTFHWETGSKWAFRAGESRSLAFDLQMKAGMSDTLWGLFGHAHSRPRLVTVTP